MEEIIEQNKKNTVLLIVLLGVIYFLIFYQIAITVLPRLDAILEKLTQEPETVILPEMSGQRDRECQEFVEENYQVEVE